jgi:hypothetical protein
MEDGGWKRESVRRTIGMERGVQSLCEKLLSPVGDEVTSLKLFQKPPISGEK